MMWGKIKAYAIANPKIAAFSIFLDLFIIGVAIKTSIVTTMILVGSVGMVVLAAMAFIKYLEA